MLLHAIGDSFFIDLDAAQLFRSQVHPGASQSVQPFDVPSVFLCVIRAKVYAEHEKLACKRGHAIFVGNHITIKNEASFPRRLQMLPSSIISLECGVATPFANQKSEPGEIRGRWD